MHLCLQLISAKTVNTNLLVSLLFQLYEEFCLLY